MPIHREPNDPHSICSYQPASVTIGSTVYHRSLFLNQDTLILDWPVHTGIDLNETTITPLIELSPHIILLGLQTPHLRPPMSLLAYVSTHHIGLECMTIGAAARTFNLLLSERRQVVAGFIFENA